MNEYKFCSGRMFNTNEIGISTVQCLEKKRESLGEGKKHHNWLDLNSPLKAAYN